MKTLLNFYTRVVYWLIKPALAADGPTPQGGQAPADGPALVAQWRRIADIKFNDANFAAMDEHRNLITQQAFAYFECADQLEALIKAPAQAGNSVADLDPEVVKQDGKRPG